MEQSTTRRSNILKRSKKKERGSSAHDRKLWSAHVSAWFKTEFVSVSAEHFVFVFGSRVFQSIMEA
eukprot:1792051-Rhodomonas_salina.1